MKLKLLNQLSLFFLIVAFMSAGQVFGQVAITPSVKSICTGSTNVSLDPIIISETSVDDFSTTPGLVSYILTLSGANISLSGGNIFHSSTGSSDVVSASISIVSNSIQITISVSGVNVLDVLTVNGLQASLSTGTGTIGVLSRIPSSGGSATVAGSFTDYGTITGITTPFGGSITPQGPFCGSGTTTLTIAGLNGASTYSWGVTAGAGTITGSSFNPTLDYNNSNVTITVSGLNGVCKGGVLTQNITINADPTGGVFNPIPQLCIGGGSKTLTVSGVSGATSYNWGIISGPGSLSGSTGNTITFNYPTVGNTVVSVAGVNGACLGDIFTQTITVSSLPTGGTLAPAGTNLCANSSITLTLSGISNATSYIWGAILGTPTINGSGLTRTVNYGTTDFQITVIGFNGICQASSPIGYNYFSVNPIPSAPTSGSSNSRCGTGSLTIGAFGGSSSNYRWYLASVGGILQGTSGNLFNTPSISTTTTFYAASFDGLGCESTRLPVLASVTGSLPPPSGSNINRCVGQPIVPVTASGINLKWYSDPSLTNVLASGVNTFSIPGLSNLVSTTVGLYVTQSSGGGCESGIKSISYTISDTTQLSLQNIGDYVCLNSTSTFTVTGFPSGGVFINNNTAFTTTLPGSTIRVTPTNFPSTLTSFTLNYRLTNSGGCTSLYSKTVQVTSPIVPTVFTPDNLSKIAIGDYRVDLSSPQLANFLFLGPGNFVTNNQLNPITSVAGNFITLSVTGIDLNGCNTRGNVIYELVLQPSNLFIDIATGTSLGTSFCQGSNKRDFILNLDAASVPGESSVANSIPYYLDPVSISGTGVPDPVTPNVSSLSGISYQYFSNTPLVTSTGLTTIGGIRYAAGSFDPRTSGAQTIIFNYVKSSPQYTWDPVRPGKFGIPVGTNKFVYSGQIINNTIPIVAPTINITPSTPPTFFLPPDSTLRCSNSPQYAMSGSSPLINFSWVSSGTGLGANQPAGLINNSAPFYFNPSAVGIKGGIYTITAFINQSGCSSSSSKTVVINDTTGVSFLTVSGSQFAGGIPSTYCKDTRVYPLDNFVTVSGGFNQGIYEYKTIDAVKSSGIGYTFDANLAKTGNNTVSFVFTNTTTGCVSRKRTTVRVDSAAFIRMPVLPPVCAGIRFGFTGTVGGVNPSYSTIAGHTWTSRFADPGSFGTQTILGGRVSNNYLPTPTDTVNQQVWMVLTSAPTGNSCPQVSDSVLVNINPNAQLFTRPFAQFCASDPILMTATLSGSATSATWIITQPGFTYNKQNPTVSNGETIQIFPSAAFLNAGGTIAPAILSTSGVGACTSKSVNSIIQIDQRPRVTVGFVTPVSTAIGNNLSANSCARNSIQVFANVTAGRVAGLPPQVAGGVWRTTGSGTFAGSSANTTGNTSDTYLPSLADTTSGRIQLIFTTSVLGGSFCSAATDTITVNFYRPPVARATVVNGNVCGNASVNLIGTIRSGARIFGNLADGVVFDQWQKIVEGANVADTNYQYTPNRATGAASYAPNVTEASQGATLRFVMTTGIPNSGVCPLVRDTVRVFVSQPARMTIIRDTTSYCAYRNGYVNLKANFSGSTPSATWTSGTRNILPATWITSVSGFNIPLVSSYYPTVQEARTGPDITFVLTSGKPVKSPTGSPLGTPNTCPIIRDSIRLSIKRLPTLRIVDLASSYCNTGEYIINTIPSVGEPGVLPAVLTGPGINGNTFSPADAVSAITTIGGVGRIPITLMYRNGDGCYKDTTQYTIVNPLPRVDFTVSTICSGADTVLLYGKNNPLGGVNTFVVNTNTINGVALRDSISTWKWDVSPIQVVRLNRGDSIPTAKLRLADPGSQSITLTVKSLQGCVNSVNRNITFYPYPKVDFSFKGQCLTDTAIFIDQSTTNSSSYNIGTWVWDFGDGFVTSSGAGIIPNGTHGGNTKGTYTIPKHYYANPGQYNVKLSLTTSQSNCSRQDSAIFNVLPRIKVGPQAPYQQNFAQDNGYFVAAGQNNSWTFGIPNKQRMKVSAGERAWFTGRDTSYNSSENSWVECPCFDFSDMKKPMVSMDFVSLMDTLAGDGAMLIYTTDTNEVWKTLGAVDNKGLNWYNRINLSNSQPGDRAGLASKGITYPGWGGYNANWATARYILDALAGEKKVRFRVVFGATSSPKDKIYEGFAFKNFIIKERSKVVLLEHFTNAADFTTLPTAGLSNIIPAIDDSTVAVINRLNRANTAVNVLPIFYHTNFPGPDPVNALNPTPVSARSLYYGISSVPRTVLDGSYFKGNSFTQPGGWTEQTVTKRALEDPAFAIQFDVVTTTSNVTATAEITALRDLPSSIYLFQMAAIENLLSVPGIVGGNGQRNFYYSLRRYLPNQDGTTYPNKSWTKGEKTRVSQTWTYTPEEKPFDPAQIGVVGFMQNFTSQEVFQVGYKVPGLAANITKEPLEENLATSNVIIYPNPGNDLVFIKGNLDWVGGKISVVDALGQLVFAGEISPEGKATLITQDWKSGVYQVVVVDVSKGATYKQKVIIQH